MTYLFNMCKKTIDLVRNSEFSCVPSSFPVLSQIDYFALLFLSWTTRQLVIMLWIRRQWVWVSSLAMDRDNSTHPQTFCVFLAHNRTLRAVCLLANQLVFFCKIDKTRANLHILQSFIAYVYLIFFFLPWHMSYWCHQVTWKHIR